MKILDIAFKDIQRALRSGFGVVMMFIVPIMIPAIIYAAFGSMLTGSTDGGDNFNMSVTRVVVVNLDRTGGPYGGQRVVEALGSDSLANLLSVTEADNEIAAREQVNTKQADVAVIIPGGFGQPGSVNITIYHDPTLTLGPLITKQIISSMVDYYNGALIAVQIAAVQAPDARPQQIGQQYGAWIAAQVQQQPSGQHPMLTIQAPPSKAVNQSSANMMSSMTVGMLVFFAFYTAASMAQSILKEEEDGTLPRLFTTPTPRATILGGKFTAIFMMVSVQVFVVMIIASLLFKITWGDPLLVALSIVGLVICAAGFGLFLLSFIKNTRQAGPMIGGVLTVTAMLGGLYSMTIPNAPAFLDTVSLFMPQGWVMRSWKLTLNGGQLIDVLLPVLVAVAIGAVLFGIGTLNFRKRYA
jgi:ABC-2 type transport system permease protein